MMVTPRAFKSRIMRNSVVTSLVVRGAVGSSIIRILTFLLMALAISTICCIAGDRLRTFCDGSSETPIWSNSSLVRRSRSLISTKMPGVVFSPRKTFSAALMPGIKVNS